MTIDALPPTAQEAVEAAKSFDLADYRENWEELTILKREYDLAKARYELYLKRLKAKAGNADQLVLDGQVVATHAISGAFNVAKFRQEQPARYDAYTKQELVEVFDFEEFAKHHPNVVNEYRARSLRFKN